MIRPQTSGIQGNESSSARYQKKRFKSCEESILDRDGPQFCVAFSAVGL